MFISSNLNQMKTTYIGIVRGQKTKITFPAENAKEKLSKFCTNYGADITTFKKQEK